jgi:hypothetical protein
MRRSRSCFSLKNIIILGGLIALCLFTFNVSNSQGQEKLKAGCKYLKDAAKFIQGVHKETIVFRGLSRVGHLTFIYLNENTGTWTAAIVYPTHPSQLCIVDSGTTGEMIQEKDTVLNRW